MWLPPPHEMAAQSGKAKHVAPFSFKALKKTTFYHGLFLLIHYFQDPKV